MKSRNTHQKNVMRCEVVNMNSFFSGEDLLNRVRKSDPSIGKATVYRFLKEMKDKKLLHFYNCDRKTLYSKSQKSHCHFICEKCSTTKHIEIKNLDFLKKNMQEEICHFQIDVYGLCSECNI